MLSVYQYFLHIYNYIKNDLPLWSRSEVKNMTSASYIVLLSWKLTI